MLTLNDGRSELWQWDTNRKLTVDAECSQVHFSNKVFGRSIDVDVVDGVATIPDILLQTGKDLNVWAFVGTAENGYTKINKVFKVNKRNKPADYVFTPPEQTTLEEILEKIDYLESIQDPDAIKNAVEDYLDRNPVEAPVQSVNGKTGKIKLTAEDVGAISQEDLQEATNEALAQAKASGEFKGEPGRDGADGSPGKDGYTPQKGIDYFDGKDGADGKDGKDGTPGADGKDYILTEADKREIAGMAAELVEVPEAPEVSMKPLTFTGAVNATYDGSEAVSVEIPQGGGGSGGGEPAWQVGETVLAEGVLPVGTETAFHSTGVTFKDLKEWDIFGISVVNPTKGHTVGIGMHGNTMATFFSEPTSGLANQRSLFKWLDADKLHLMQFMANSNWVTYANGDFRPFVSITTFSNGVFADGHMDASIRKVSGAFGALGVDTPLAIKNHQTLTSELKFRVVGIRKAV